MVQSQRKLYFHCPPRQQRSPFTPVWALARGLWSPEVTKWRCLWTKPSFISCPSHLPPALNPIGLLGEPFGTSRRGQRPKMHLKRCLTCWLRGNEINKQKGGHSLLPRLRWMFYPVIQTGQKNAEASVLRKTIGCLHFVKHLKDWLFVNTELPIL